MTSGSEIDHAPHNKQRVIEAAFCFAAGLLFVILSLTLEPIRTGDGHSYFSMLEALSRNGSPAITEDVDQAVFDTFGLRVLNTGYTMQATDGSVYAIHFFGYSLLCVPVHKLLLSFDINGLKAFQMTNALLLFGALLYTLIISRLSAIARWFVATGFVLSTGILYFRWMHPELFSASCVLISSIAFMEKRYKLATLFAAIGSLQNPSVAFMVIPIVLAQLIEIGRGECGRLSARNVISTLLPTALISLLVLLPYLWSYVQFDRPNPLVGSTFIDYSHINPGRLSSFIFDLNQGLVIGLPLLIWAVAAAAIYRTLEILRGDSKLLQREDFLLLGFLLLVIPTLAQTNSNADQAVFLRYAAWAGMTALVWVAVIIGRQNIRMAVVAGVPAIALQIAMILYLNVLAPNRQQALSYVFFKPWILPIWNFYPHIYDPLPEIFLERLNHSEVNPTSRVIFGYHDEVLRVLTKNTKIELIAEEVCGSSGKLVALEHRRYSEPKISQAERGYHYLTGRLRCLVEPPATFSLASGATGAEAVRFLAGWSSQEASGRWSVRTDPRLKLNLNVNTEGRRIGVRLIGNAYVTELHPKQRIAVRVNGRAVASWTVVYPDSAMNRLVPLDSGIDGMKGSVLIELSLPDAVAPCKLTGSGDCRLLGLHLTGIGIEYSD